MEISDLMIGDVLLVKGQNWVSKAIHWFTNSRYSHAVCYVGNGEIIESSVGGVQVNLLSKYDEYTVMRHIDYTTIEDKLNFAVDFMRGEEGKKYDYLGLIGIAYTMLFNKPRNIFDGKNRYWCSELVADGYLSAGITLDVPQRTFKVSPADFHRSVYMKEVMTDVRFG